MIRKRRIGKVNKTLAKMRRKTTTRVLTNGKHTLQDFRRRSKKRKSKMMDTIGRKYR